MVKNNFYILFFLAPVFSFAQVNLYSSVNTKETKLNTPVIFTVVLEIVGEDLIQESPIKLPDFSKFDYAVSSEQSTFIDPVKKIRINQMVYQFSLDPKQTGAIKIGSALVKVNGKMYKSEPIDISVREADKKSVATTSATKSMYLNLQVADREVYKDEPVIAIIRAYSRNMSGFRHLKAAKIESNKSFTSLPIANVDEPVEEKENDFSSQVVGMFVLVPNVSGYIDVPTAELPSVNHIGHLVSNKVKINVKKLPDGAPKSFKNAVGKYNLKVELIDKNKENYEINKAFNIAVKVNGTGNLSPAILPKILPSADFDSYTPKIVNNSIATTNGIEGSVEAHYVIVPKKRGNVRILTEDFSYFDPKQQKYVELGSGMLALNTVNAQDIANSKTTLEKVNEYTNNVLETVNSPVISTQKLKVEGKKGINWLGVVGNLMIVAAASFIFIYANKKRKKYVLAQREKQLKKSKPITTIAETEALLRKESKPDISSYHDYQEKMINLGNADKFFYSVEEMRSEVEQYCKEHFSQSFSEYLQSRYGFAESEKYHRLFTNINTEKYSPSHTTELQHSLLTEIKEVYSLL